MHLKRREFLKAAAVSIPSALVPRQVFARQEKLAPTRTLGRTGLKVAALGLGAMQVSDPAIIRHGIDQGINYIDTADCYLGGRNEKVVGKAIGGKRDQLVLATKVHISKESRMRRSVEQSLASLGVSEIDIMQLHGLSSGDQVRNKDVKRAMLAMKKEGKFKFAAVTTHSNQVEVLEAVSEEGFYDVVLVAVNYRSPAKLYRAIAQAADEGVGIVAMKTQNGGYNDSVWADLTPHQAALRFVLEKPGVHLAVPGMLSRKMIDENLEAVRRDGGISDIIRLENYRIDLAGKACSFCSSCLDQCRNGTGGLDAVRVMMYAEGYGDKSLAFQNAGNAASAIRLCIDCKECTVTCSQGIDIKDAARKASPYVA